MAHTEATQRLMRQLLDPLRHLKARLLGRTVRRPDPTIAYARYEWPPGHFYSPLPDLDEVERRADVLFARDASTGLDLDLNDEAQKEWIDQAAALAGDFDWTTDVVAAARFHLGNRYFEIGDAYALYAMMRMFRPGRIVEVGSGHSSALMLDVSDRFLEGRTSFVFIDPFPDRLLASVRDQDRSRYELIRRPVQSVPLSYFERLGSGDFVFVDSSHVGKIGSDVNFLLFEVLPRLADGVLVHFHDICWPFEYPREWVQKGRCWNEAYLLRAFLQYNQGFEVLLFNDYLSVRHRSLLAARLPMVLADRGSSLWLRKVGART